MRCGAYVILIASFGFFSGCGHPVNGTWEGWIKTSEVTIDRFGRRTHRTETAEFGLVVKYDGEYLNGRVMWPPAMAETGDARIILSKSFAGGTVLGEDTLVFRADTSTRSAPAIGHYEATIEGNAMSGTLTCIGEGYHDASALYGEFTLKRQ